MKDLTDSAYDTTSRSSSLDEVLNKDTFVSKRALYGGDGYERFKYIKQQFRNIIEAMIPITDAKMVNWCMKPCETTPEVYQELLDRKKEERWIGL